MTKLTQPTKWHGGKNYLAPWIISHFPEHVHYVEPYFGGGSVLLQKPVDWVEGHSEVVNDLNGDLTNFWCVLQSEKLLSDFQRIIDAIPFSQFEFKHSDELNGLTAEHGLGVQRAVWFFVKYRQSRQGLGKDFATLSRNRTRRGMNEQVSSWLTAIEGLPEVHERLKRVVILNRDAIDVIKQQDGPRTLFYLDPPYLHSTRSSTGEYEHEMDIDDHSMLLASLCEMKGKFILSGYHNVMYDKTARHFGWRCEEKQIDNKASSAKTKELKTECLWMNF